MNGKKEVGRWLYRPQKARNMRMYGGFVRTNGMIVEVKSPKHKWVKFTECETEQEAHTEALLLQSYLMSKYGLF